MYGEIEYTDDIREASYILMLLNASNKDALDYYDLHGVSIPVVCVNPDVTCMHGDAIRYTAGYFAKQYSDRHGCEVYYYGKPYDNIYNMAFRKARAPKDRILAIGDTIETDILGANNNGVDSMLVLSGILNGKERKRKIQHSTAKVYHRFFACIDMVLCPEEGENRCSCYLCTKLVLKPKNRY